MTEAQDHLLDWLQDAHAMEEQAESMLLSMSLRLTHYPELKTKIDRHIDETREQAMLLATCIERQGGATSAVKDTTGKLMASGQAFMNMFASDEVIKAGLASYAFEHFEIAAYSALIVAAEQAGDTDTQTICERILQQEVAMAAWLSHNLSGTTRKFMKLSGDPELIAKR